MLLQNLDLPLKWNSLLCVTAYLVIVCLCFAFAPFTHNFAKFEWDLILYFDNIVYSRLTSLELLGYFSAIQWKYMYFVGVFDCV